LTETDLAPTALGAPQLVTTAVDTRVRRSPSRPKLKDTWWRHVVGISATIISLFPVAYMISSAFNRDQTIGGATLVPLHVTLRNFGNLLHNNVSTSGGGKADAPFVDWYLNSLLVASVTAFFTVLLGALAAYAFSRFRFKGRRMGMMTLLLIQMFPQFIAVVAIYLIILNVGNVFSVIGINSLLAVIIVYLGGSMGIQAWLMKGFFDTIPRELDESARVDGATPGQIFWGVIMPLAAPVLVVVALMSFVFTLNEFILASAILQSTNHFTLPVGLRGFIDQQYGQRWGPFTAGALLSAIPIAALFFSLQRYFVRGLTAGSVKG
jgi:arabinogalactan oligomer / maltooligosaccharide transport system permease protein